MSIVAAYVVPHPPLIVPAVGHGQERAIQATVDAYEEVARRIAAHEPDTIVVVSPHAPLYYDCFHISTGDAAHGDMGRFDAWEAAMNVPYDPSFAAAVSACARARGVPICGSGMRDGELDHATFVPLHFVNERYAGYRLVRVGLSGLTPADHREVGRCVAEAACDLDRTCVLVASGDLSHKLKEDGPYGFAPEGPVFDRTVTGLFDEGDLEGLFSIDAAFREAAAECGLGSFQIMAGALDGVDFAARPALGRRLAIVIGNEARGVSPEALALADVKLRLPMRGGAESLNAAVAAGILMYALTVLEEGK